MLACVILVGDSRWPNQPLIIFFTIMQSGFTALHYAAGLAGGAECAIYLMKKGGFKLVQVASEVMIVLVNNHVARLCFESLVPISSPLRV